MKIYKIIFRDGEYTLTRWTKAVDEHFLTRNEKWNEGYAELQVSNWETGEGTHLMYVSPAHWGAIEIVEV